MHAERGIRVTVALAAAIVLVAVLAKHITQTSYGDTDSETVHSSHPFAAWVLNALNLGRNDSKFPMGKKRESACQDMEAIKYIQKLQLKAARRSLFGGDQWLYDDEQSMFYDFEGFGAALLKRKKKEMVYYRIWKNGNDNIRAHLEQYSRTCNAGSNGTDAAVLNSTKSSECAYQQQSLEELRLAMRARKYFAVERFAFTFTRDPVSRFVSAYTEVEYRLQGGMQYSLPLYSPLGSVYRVREFVDMLLKAKASNRLMSQKDKANSRAILLHIMPQIGTLVSANEIEGGSLLLYKLEHFESEWERLANESGFPALGENGRLGLGLGLGERLVTQPSSLDPLGTSKAARELLLQDLIETGIGSVGDEVASQDTSQDTAGAVAKRQRRRQNGSEEYLRAICRMYLADFMCAHYELPAACVDLAAEWTLQYEDFLRGGGGGEAAFLDPDSSDEPLPVSALASMWTLVLSATRFVLPTLVLRPLAEAVCVLSNPQCVSDIVLGPGSAVDE
jgi:hypothetical protein